ncbi:hypothetical protein GCM10008922_26150 [Faecalicatena contorta]|uniref:type II toxin-antitoxin system MqsA family antitoxin n=1 Tax=Faecalicatena contorta TaxID=39482 RepID=UPI002E9BEA1D|nr:type II toxin-antitoxin system MqsA family antitoxin [Muricomes sp.]
MKCLSCKNGDMAPSTTTFFSDLGNCMLIIKNVPCMKCSQCGEVLFKASVHQNIEKIMKKAKSLASELTVLEYDTVA